MKPWPEDDKPAEFSDIANPLVNAIRFAYWLERQNEDIDIPYDGLNIGKDCAATCLPANEVLSAKRLEGYDPLEQIIMLAVQLGIEQGRRITMKGNAVKMLRIKLAGLQFEKNQDVDAYIAAMNED